MWCSSSIFFEEFLTALDQSLLLLSFLSFSFLNLLVGFFSLGCVQFPCTGDDGVSVSLYSWIEK
jgi:hypothetical protein